MFKQIVDSIFNKIRGTLMKKLIVILPFATVFLAVAGSSALYLGAYKTTKEMQQMQYDYNTGSCSKADPDKTMESDPNQSGLTELESLQLQLAQVQRESKETGCLIFRSAEKQLAFINENGPSIDGYWIFIKSYAQGDRSNPFVLEE
jgi:hypothetical protein